MKNKKRDKEATWEEYENIRPGDDKITGKKTCGKEWIR